jgi:hypothetical protein
MAACPLADGRPLEVVGSWADITGRKDADRAAAPARPRQPIGYPPLQSFTRSKATGDFSPTFNSRTSKHFLGHESSDVARAYRLILENLDYASRVQSAMLPARHSRCATIF